MPRIFSFDASALQNLALVTQLGGPFAAATLCLLAARRSRGGDRAAWINFGIGSTLYLVGNLVYAYDALNGIVPNFPSAPEASYFLMAGFFAAGIFQYGKVLERVSRVQVYDFIMICCTAVVAGLFVLRDDVATSVMDVWPTTAAFAYPALWFSVAAFGLVSLVLYDQRGKRFILSLLFVAMAAEALADYRYALTLMNGTYEMGGITQILWVASAGLIVWAASEQIAVSRRPAVERPIVSSKGRMLAQAALPAAIIATTLISATLTGNFGHAFYVAAATVGALVVGGVIGLREQWMIHLQGQLRGSMERSQAELILTEKRLRSVLQSTSDSVVVLDRDWKVVYFNERAFETVMGATALKLGVSVWDLFPAISSSAEGAYYRRAVETGEPQEFEIFAPERKIWLGIHAYPAPDGLSIFFRDISERRRVREEINHMAHHDSLTGLPARAVFQERLKTAIGGGEKVAVVLFDLDQFKEVNDTLGHLGGDVVLSVTAERMQSCMRSPDMIARLGGDEFAAILIGYPSRIEIDAVIRPMLDLVCRPITVEGQSVRVGASAGIALSSDPTDNPERIVRNADLALYAAKDDEGERFRFFEPQMERRLVERLALSTELATAIEQNQFELAYQPIMDLRTGRVCTFEALLRWRHPERGIISPEDFIPLAEESGLIVPIGEWVLRTACTEALKWPPDVSVAVNLSPRQVTSRNLLDRVTATLKVTGLDPARLELEVTEIALLKDSKANALTLRRFGDMGIRVALDDFGTGYSSLGYLQKFAFSKLKIDRSFISGLPDRKESQAIVEAVIGLGKSLGIRVTAEGVETQAQLDWIKAGCDEAQGFLIGRPVPGREIPALLNLWLSQSDEAANRTSLVA